MSKADRSQNSKNAVLRGALKLSARGIAVIPVNGKVPLIPAWQKKASSDTSVIEGWWREWPTANVGIVTGLSSKIWVLDIDGEQGEQSIRRLQTRNGEIPDTVEVITGGGGRHLYFTLPEDLTIRNSVAALGPGLDVRGDNGFVVAPPSIHASGRKYSWSVDSAHKMTAAPRWLVALVQQKAKNEFPIAQDHNLDSIPQGGRNDAIARLVGMLLRKDVPASMCLELCLCWNAVKCKPPLRKEEIVKTVSSIATREVERRGKK